MFKGVLELTEIHHNISHIEGVLGLKEIRHDISNMDHMKVNFHTPGSTRVSIAIIPGSKDILLGITASSECAANLVKVGG